ncbi:response regulator [Desulfovibrio sp. OttesenSCG-928-F20]|nr:response regulator [Desulfovibrio sp. OttesenSCG-928-F20]
MTEKRKTAVLLVDDEAEFASTLAERLNLRGYSAFVDPDGEKALERLARPDTDCVDLVLLDVKLPGMDGIEVLRRIKALQAALPVILLTGQAGARDGIEGMKLGAAGYLSKPVDLQELLDLFASLGVGHA